MRLPGFSAETTLHNTNEHYQEIIFWPKDITCEKVLPQISAISCRCEPDCNSHTLGSIVCSWRDPVRGIVREYQWWNPCLPDISRIMVGQCYMHPFWGCVSERYVRLASGRWQYCGPSPCPPDRCENIW
jgi:hypothetical protein